MALGFATIDIALTTRLNGLNNFQLEVFKSITTEFKIKSMYEKYAIANVIAFSGYYTWRCADKSLKKAFDKLINKGVLKISSDNELKEDCYYLA